MNTNSSGDEAGLAQVTGASALSIAARRALPLVEERRGTVLRNTRDVARRLTLIAIDLFSARGFDAVTVGDIAERAQVTRRTFFRYFPAKETIVLDIYDQVCEELVGMIECTPSQTDALSALTGVMVTWCSRFEELLMGLSDLGDGSPSLRSAALLRSTVWEERMAEAAGKRFPELDQGAATVWSVSAMGILRAAQKKASSAGTLSSSVEELVRSLRHLAAPEARDAE
jgi:AcrR family transcriptional regulator